MAFPIDLPNRRGYIQARSNHRQKETRNRMESGSGDITLLLQQYRRGDRTAEAQLFSRVYAELHRLAARYLRSERPDHPLQPTALVNEAYLRLVGQREKDWVNRAHFVAVSASIMRQVLVDFARRAKAEKRDFGVAPEPLDESISAAPGDLDMVVAVDAALTKLAEYDKRQSRVVELRYFAGFRSRKPRASWACLREPSNGSGCWRARGYEAS
jgi:RNA polymerase sigma-70 factor, ECF subfamily